MKPFKSLIYIFLAITIIGCNSSPSNVFESEKLRGKYEVDLTPMIAKATSHDEGDTTTETLAKGFAGLALSSIQMEINFYENNKGILSLDGGFFNLIASMNDDASGKHHEFNYKVEQDSILFLKDIEDKEYAEIGVIKKISDHYDFIQLVTTNKNTGEKNMVTMKKIIE